MSRVAAGVALPRSGVSNRAAGPVGAVRGFGREEGFVTRLPSGSDGPGALLAGYAGAAPVPSPSAWQNR